MEVVGVSVVAVALPKEVKNCEIIGASLAVQSMMILGCEYNSMLL